MDADRRGRAVSSDPGVQGNVSARTEETPRIRLMIVGAPKAGTTSLKEYLGAQPRLMAHRQRELIYFASDRQYERGYRHMLDVYYRNARAGVLLVAKSVALMYSETGLERLRAHNPDVQLAVVLRNPVDRAYSEYWYARRRGWEEGADFDAVIAGKLAAEESASSPTAYLARGRYAEALRLVLRVFPREQLHVFTTEELHADPLLLVREMLESLPEVGGPVVSEVQVHENRAAWPRSQTLLRLLSRPDAATGLRRAARAVLPEHRRHRFRQWLLSVNERRFTPPPLPARTRETLVEYYRPWNLALEELLGRPFDMWNE